MDKESKTLDDSEGFHDFMNERLILKIIGCYNVLNNSRLQFFFNIIFIIWASLLYLYMITTGIYTLFLPNTGTGFKLQISQALGVMSAVIVVPLMNFYYRHNYLAAVEFLKHGFDKYLNEKPDVEHIKFKRLRVRQVRLWSFIFGVLSYLAAAFHIFQPVFKYIFLEAGVEDPNETINPYLPLPLYVPFSTSGTLGYAIAFSSNVIYLILLYTMLMCYIETLLSSTLQLLAQIEILNYSLLNIQSRASFVLYLNSEFSGQFNNSLDPEEELQKNLYLCLKTSLQHHQAIIRYYKEVKEYVGAMNTFCLLIFAFLFASSMVPVLQDPLRNLALIIQLMTELTGYFQLFLVGQIISDTSVNTINSLYSTPWMHSNKNYRVMLNIMLTIAKKPIILRAPFFNADWTLETFGGMLSGAYKLVNLMLNAV